MKVQVLPNIPMTLYFPMIAKSGVRAQEVMGKGIVKCCSTTCEDVATLQGSWYYNYGYTESLCQGAKFVPMVWGPDYMDVITRSIASGARIVMGFNEMNVPQPAGCGLTLDQAVNSYYQLESLIPETVTLIGPSLYDYVNQPYGYRDFVQEYRSRYGKLPRQDKFSVHWYYSASNVTVNFGEYMDKYHRDMTALGYPESTGMWVTEFGFLNATSASQSQLESAMGKFIAEIRKRKWVEAYSYFAPRLEGFKSMEKSRLIDSLGKPTNLGQMYKSW